ncbi:hypothetical protein ABZ215_25055 [Amycolatopsis sp. NPDC006131]|uniref:hypothetical protein n=1 Tax=Amycolatopsis sp. NPDC006131 TaxID=3156731 RepID=UPI0033BD5A7D
MNDESIPALLSTARVWCPHDGCDWTSGGDGEDVPRLFDALHQHAQTHSLFYEEPQRDIIDAIDAATGCQQCGGPLGESPSDDFCSDWCQGVWHEARAERLTVPREPHGIGCWAPLPEGHCSVTNPDTP